jgi:type VI secretion system protein ImpG
MHPDLLDYYSRELRHVREGASEFAREFPQVAGRLGLQAGDRSGASTLANECPDPHVERLLEGFAYLTARVQLKQDAEFPRFSQHLLETVYPHYLPPTPSMAVVQLQPNLQEGALAAGYVVPRHSVLRARLGPRQQTGCKYRTAHEVTLLPLEVARAEYRAGSGHLGDLTGVRVPGMAQVRAGIRLRLRVAGGLGFHQVDLDRLPLFLGGDARTATRLYELLLGHRVAVLARPGDESASWHMVGAGQDAVVPLGFSDEQALLPFGPRSFQGYRLLHEYFAFPQRFLFLEVRHLREVARRHQGDELDIMFLLDRGDEALEGAVHAGRFALHCTPVINLFPKRADRITLDDRSESSHEHQVIPDRTRPLDYEVHSIGEVVGLGAGDLRQDFQPLHGAHRRPAPGSGGEAFFTVRREPRRLSARQQQRGARTGYTGSETFLALVDGNEGPFRAALKQLAIETLCTNRDLPLMMPLSQGPTDFTLEAGAPVTAIRCLEGPTPPRASHAHRDVTWRLISHLSLNYLSLTDGAEGAGALRELLRLYADFGEAANRGQVDSVRSIASQPVVRRFPGPGPVGFARGLQIQLTCDESASEGLGAFLLGSVLERFFARHVSINAFTETVLRSVQRGELMRWPARPGQRQVF